MRILTLDGAGTDASATLLELCDESLVRIGHFVLPTRGGAERLASVVSGLLGSASWDVASLALIAAVTGPGSFTGLRATLSLAQGLALGLTMRADLPLHGVTRAEALRRSVGDTGGRPLWCVTIARRDRVFIETDAGSGPRGTMLDALPSPAEAVLLAGDAAALVAARIARAIDSGVERPTPEAIAEVALDRLSGRLPPLAALPLYVDAPEAKLPAGGLRPAPV
ncbi:tRNA (adenosine(37)-N6)-threonylcarbamoyltransferase complex dimerization subunit type 1 TsaB [Lichenicoccus sp.]|uniref:tRNA (adenosine(37)-N6)-threonylcarbamoyltransferase complex dimerization subunit type 1 TsaB n=1 Tax=Lichenicoccus sp. TaxID=2781899 RepID=UPI003D0CE768